MRAAIPAAPERAARNALASNASTRMLAGAPLVPVRGGLSNHAWRTEYAGRSYFVRLGGPNAERLGVDRITECRLLSAVSSAGLAPEILACDPAADLLVTSFLPGRTWTREDAHSTRNIARLAARLRILHALPHPGGVRVVDFQAQARNLMKELAATCDRASARSTDDPARDLESASAPEDLIHGHAASAHRRLAARPARLAVCHNDLHHLNLLDDGEGLWLVDWEYGGLGDPLFDLASYACQHELSAAERTALLDAYAAEDADDSPDALDAACFVFDHVQWLWYRLWAVGNPGADGEYLARAEVLARRLAGSAD